MFCFLAQGTVRARDVPCPIMVMSPARHWGCAWGGGMLVALEGEEAEGVGYAVGVVRAEGGDEGGGELGEGGEVEEEVVIQLYSITSLCIPTIPHIV